MCALSCWRLRTCVFGGRFFRRREEVKRRWLLELLMNDCVNWVGVSEPGVFVKRAFFSVKLLPCKLDIMSKVDVLADSGSKEVDL